MNRWQCCVLHSQTLRAGQESEGFLVKQVTSFSFWVISPSGSELPAVQLHTCRNGPHPTSPAGALVLGLGSIVISNGILGRGGSAGNKVDSVIPPLLLRVRPCHPAGPSLPELRFLQCNAFQILSAKCFEGQKQGCYLSWLLG